MGHQLRAISLFSGCGGSDLGAKRAGVDVILANDNCPPAAATYRKYKDLLASSDTKFLDCSIKDITAFPEAELLLGCYPCQSFTMGGKRKPQTDPRTRLYEHFLRCLNDVRPQFFVAENVAGMKWLADGQYLDQQLVSFTSAGPGYRVSAQILDARDFGLPAERKRIFIVGARRDLAVWYHFPSATHGPGRDQPYGSHGQAIKHLPLCAVEETYTQGREPFSWWYMSRNRKRDWSEPGYTVVANWRHVTLHPGSPKMQLVWTNWRDGSKQKWEFTDVYDAPEPYRLEQPRRLTWHECSVLQGFPPDFEPDGTGRWKYWQIGNAVPPPLMESILAGIVQETAIRSERPAYGVGPRAR